MVVLSVVHPGGFSFSSQVKSNSRPTTQEVQLELQLTAGNSSTTQAAPPGQEGGGEMRGFFSLH